MNSCLCQCYSLCTSCYILPGSHELHRDVGGIVSTSSGLAAAWWCWEYGRRVPRWQLHRQAVSLSCLGLDRDRAFICASTGLLQRLHHQSLCVHIGFWCHWANGIALGGGRNIGCGYQDHRSSRGWQEELGERECCRWGGGRSYRDSWSNCHGGLVSSLYRHIGSRLLGEWFGQLLLLLWLYLLLSCLGEGLLLLLADGKAGGIFPLWKLRLDCDCSGSGSVV